MMPEDVVGFPIHVDLFVEEPVLGDPSRFIRTAGITFHEPVLHRLSLDALPHAARTRPDLANAGIMGIRVPFDFEELPGHGHYVEARVVLAFDTGGVRAQTARLVFDEPDGAKPAGRSPVVRTFGLSSATLHWTLLAQPGRPIEPGGHEVGTILKVPPESRKLTGSLDASATVARRARRLHTVTMASLRFAIDLAEGQASLYSAE
jgi:hypothetical protein